MTKTENHDTERTAIILMHGTAIESSAATVTVTRKLCL